MKKIGKKLGLIKKLGADWLGFSQPDHIGLGWIEAPTCQIHMNIS